MLAKYQAGQGAKILDFGCGSGFLVGELQKRGYDAFGTDVSKEAVEFGRSNNINNLSVQDSHVLNFPDNSFDLVVALDVIEHIKDDGGAMRELERVLKPGGTVIITVPAYMWMWGVQDEVAHHFRRYTAGSFAKILHQSSALKIIRQTYFNIFLFPPIAVVRTLSRWLNLKERESDFEVNNGWLNKLFFSIFDLERKFLRHLNFLFGVSLLMVLRKND